MNPLEKELRSYLLLGFRQYRDNMWLKAREGSRRSNTYEMTHLPESECNRIETLPTGGGRHSVRAPCPLALGGMGQSGQGRPEFYKNQVSSNSVDSFDPNSGKHFLTHLLTSRSISVRGPEQWEKNDDSTNETDLEGAQTGDTGV